MGKSRSFWPVFALLGLIGLAVRAWHIGSEPFWLDEAYSAYAADHDWSFLLHVVPRFETHPPFYYSLMHVWAQAFGDGLALVQAIVTAHGGRVELSSVPGSTRISVSLPAQSREDAGTTVCA